MLSAKLCAQLTPEVVSKLREAMGIATVCDLVSKDASDIARRTGLNITLVEFIRRTALAKHCCYPVAASLLWERMESSTALFSTGCSSLDDLLDGGVLTGQLLELTGAPGSGKTQVCIAMVGHVSMATNSTVAVLDTGGGFSCQRLQQVLGSGEPDDGEEEGAVEEVLGKVRVFRVFDLLTSLSLLQELRDKVSSKVDAFHSNLHLVILDCVTGLVAPLLGGKQIQGHALMCQLATSLRRLASEHAIAVVYTNNMVSAGGFEGPGGTTTKTQTGGRGRFRPALGTSWAHVPHTRLLLSRTAGANKEGGGGGGGGGEDEREERTATIVKSSRQATGVSTHFTILDSGLQRI